MVKYLNETLELFKSKLHDKIEKRAEGHGECY